MVTTIHTTTLKAKANFCSFWNNAELKLYEVKGFIQEHLEYIFFQALLGRRNEKPKDRYSRLDQEIEKSNQTFIVDQQQQQEVKHVILKK